MSTLLVDLSDSQLSKIQFLLDQGIADNKASLVRKAIDKFIEDQLMEIILKAKDEPSLEGDIDELAARF